MSNLLNGNSDNGKSVLQTGYYYNRLCEKKSREIYCALYSSICQREDAFLFSTALENINVDADKDAWIKIFFMILADHPELFYVNLETISYYYCDIVEIKFKYIFSPEECQKLQKEIKKKLSYLILVAKCFWGNDKMYLIKYLYCYFVEHMSYAVNELKSKDEKEQCRIHSAVGALLDERAVCDGFARGFKMLLDELGIENWLIRRDIEPNTEFTHEWNVIKLDERILHIDVTWEISLYKLKKQIMYKYYMLTEEKMEKNHQKNIFII